MSERDKVTIELPEHLCEQIEKFMKLATTDKRKRTEFFEAASETKYAKVKYETCFIASALATLDYGVSEKIRHYEKQAADAKAAAEADAANLAARAKATMFEMILAAKDDSKKIAEIIKNYSK